MQSLRDGLVVSKHWPLSRFFFLVRNPKKWYKAKIGHGMGVDVLPHVFVQKVSGGDC